MLTFREKQDGKAYRMYVTDTLKNIAENTSRFAGGCYPAKRFVDIVGYGAEKEKGREKPEPTEEDVIARIAGKLRAL